MAIKLPKCVLGHSFNKENSDKLVLVHLLVEIIHYTEMHGEYKVKFNIDVLLCSQMFGISHIFKDLFICFLKLCTAFL
jgi:hypothetical protein